MPRIVTACLIDGGGASDSGLCGTSNPTYFSYLNNLLELEYTYRYEPVTNTYYDNRAGTRKIVCVPCLEVWIRQQNWDEKPDGPHSDGD